MNLPQTNFGMRSKLQKIIAMMDTLSDDICGFRYEFVFYCTQSLHDCYNNIRDHSTIDGVPEELCIPLTITPDMFRANVSAAIAMAQPVISTGKTNPSPTPQQKKAMAEVLNALGFFRRSGGNCLTPQRRKLWKKQF